MSTVFDVYPRRLDGVTFGAVIGRSTEILHELLAHHGMDASGLQLSPHLWQDGQHGVPQPTTPFVWRPASGYAFVSVKGVGGGTDVSIEDEYTPVFLDEPESLLDFLPEPTVSIPDLDTLLTYFEVGWCWCVRRSIGQPPLVNAMYGCVAAALAELSDGAIFSFDGAFPAGYPIQRAEEFLSWWFRPEEVRDATEAEWYSQCLDLIWDGVDEPALRPREVGTLGHLAALGEPAAVVHPTVAEPDGGGWQMRDVPRRGAWLTPEELAAADPFEDEHPEEHLLAGDNRLIDEPE